ncbi:Fur family transcriptional regulator [Sulfitobacter sp. F26204]|jgi:Fur family ferric uptake transcriptional regulator|uniref:Fur family transcriptional regulator n=1 Tax=Sulfitobacter sp. F26204 TaxID=2996014 RepID=UPI00225E6B30|nr:Fur family transcriptional regulator [Sulfitobacter sp. F26204]MCX7561480.1 Fur family transcriptional regulator [Sulfitobacter sp. F26204]|tara:strand:+ start:21885 stop:22322 length:438 start_codon:yes stop_codon:yes gene_type:complete
MTSDGKQDQNTAATRASDIIASNGLRITNQRVALVKVLLESDDHPDAVELHRRLRASDASISLATVYRNLASLESVGVAERHYFEGHGARYESTISEHHDHIIDLDSDEVIEFQSEEIEQLQQEVAKKLGYEVVHHRLELYCRKL